MPTHAYHGSEIVYFTTTETTGTTGYENATKWHPPVAFVIPVIFVVSVVFVVV